MAGGHALTVPESSLTSSPAARAWGRSWATLQCPAEAGMNSWEMLSFGMLSGRWPGSGHVDRPAWRQAPLFI